MQRKKKLENRFIDEFHQFNNLGKKIGIVARQEDIFPCLNDNTNNTIFDAHYIYHPAWATRVIKEINPTLHIDISSTLHFATQLSAFIPVHFYDYRPAKIQLDNMISGQCNLMNLHFKSESIHSLSCMHTIEHIGLGRYGDTIDPLGDIKAIDELRRVVEQGGHLLVVVPVGSNPRVLFNAHRIYDGETFLSLFPDFELRQFALIKDDQSFDIKAELQHTKNEKYGCGCFWFVKKTFKEQE